MHATIDDVDPFDLPEWLGTHDVVWRSDAGLETGHRVAGTLTATGAEQAYEIGCDLLAVDEAFPAPVVDDASRLRVHQAWQHGQVTIGNVETGNRESGIVLAVPGRRFTPDLVLDALARLARAVGARPESYAVLLRVGRR